MEYRVTPKAFFILVEMLTPALEKNTEMARRAMNQCGSKPISVASRVGACLIILGGGRIMEAMRTHGLSHTVAYDNFHEVIEAINAHPNLCIEYPNTLSKLKEVAGGFCKRSTHRMFEFCVGAIDGLAIQIRAPSKCDTKVQSRFWSGNKKMYCLNMQGVCDIMQACGVS